MQAIISGATVVLVALSVTVYLSLMAVLACKLVLEEPGVRRAMVPPLLPVFCQNCGIPFAILGFALRSTDLALVAILLIALGLVVRTETSASLHPSIEAPLLMTAIGALGAVALFNVIA
ncbi:MAG: hypothetical protein ACFCUQ_16495 [Kiloniellales bacterium]